MLNKFLILLFNLILILAISLVTLSFPATALLRQHHETANVLRYHAQDSLKDRDGNTWQVVLFPDRSQGSTTTYYLRLVGFPEVNAFIHPQSLEILIAEGGELVNNQGKILTASDSYPHSAPAPNVGQYDLTPILTQIPEKGSLELSLPLAQNRKLALKIPSEVLVEWQLLTQEIEKL
jgi:Protein of unknown function (DUF3122)